MCGMFSAVADATELLTYQVTISEPDSVGRAWWQVGNTGTPAQVAAALSELAARCGRELARSGSAALHWYVCDVRDGGGVQLEYFVGAVRATHLPGCLDEVAARTLELTPARRRSGPACHRLPPRWGVR
jgi:hypothetical protein